MAGYPFLPLATDAYLADTRHLSTVEHGAYLLLLMEAWRRPHCNLPDNDLLLARLAGLELADWMAIRDTILAFWNLDGRSKTWTQKRLTLERDFVAEKSASRRDAAAKRWNKEKKGDANAMQTGMQNACKTDAPIPIPIPIQLDANASNPIIPKSSAAFDDFWRVYPRKTAKEAARKAWALAIKRGASPESMTAAATRYAGQPPDDPKFIPHPATWLNQGRYDDEEATYERGMARHNGAGGSYEEAPLGNMAAAVMAFRADRLSRNG